MALPLATRSWQMLPGDPFNERYVADYILNSQRGDADLRRALAGMKATYEAHPDSATHEVTLSIRLEKQ
jgi:hypothetical protein